MVAGCEATAESIGRNAASVFPEAVAAATMTSTSPARIGPMASTWVCLNSFQCSSQIQRWIEGCSCEKAVGASEPEGSEVIVAIMVEVGGVRGAGWCRLRRGRRGDCGHDLFVVREGCKVGIRLDAQLNAIEDVGPERTWIL